jgi:septum formation protein
VAELIDGRQNVRNTACCSLEGPDVATPLPGWPERIVLASASPRRRQLLAQLGVQFEVRPAALDETPLPDEDARAHVERLAIAKATAVAAPAEVVLAADTTVELDGRIFGKPTDTGHALDMLRLLRGRTHQVHTGVALFAGQVMTSTVVTSSVRLADLDDESLRWYVATGESADKAGAYALQGAGALLVAEIYGSPTNVIGLPLHEVHRLLANLTRDVQAGDD